MTAMSGNTLEGDAFQSFDGEAPPPMAPNFLLQDTKDWHAGNLCFKHDVNDKEIDEIPIAHHHNPNKYEVPADKNADHVEYFYGKMPEALTARPVESEGCCPARTFHIARHMFGHSVATVTVDGTGCMWQAGCASATVNVTPDSQVGGASYTGSLSKSMCGECCGNETRLTWETKTKPYMALRALSTVDSCKYQFCMPVWFGWRGSSDGVPQARILYDASYIMDLCETCGLACQQCSVCKNACCDKNDMAPRFMRSEDLRRTIQERYDYEFAVRNLGDEETHDIEQGENAEESAAIKRLAPAHEVDALYTSRLYNDVLCGKPNNMWSNPQDMYHERESAVDVRYRGSNRHGTVTEDDHLIVLGGLIMQALFMFPGTNGSPSWGGPANLLRGRLAPYTGTIGKTAAELSTSAV